MLSITAMLLILILHLSIHQPADAFSAVTSMRNSIKKFKVLSSSPSQNNNDVFLPRKKTASPVAQKLHTLAVKFAEKNSGWILCYVRQIEKEDPSFSTQLKDEIDVQLQVPSTKKEAAKTFVGNSSILK
jgi:hypothetical protein